jgi:HlyD family secretion protein
MVRHPCLIGWLRAGLSILPGFLTACNPAPQQPRLSGTLEWERVELIAEKSEPVTEVLVHEGDWVEAGQIILKQDASRWQARLARNQADYGEANARYAESLEGPRPERIREAEARYQGAEQVLHIRERELNRLEQVLLRQFTSQDAVDKARAARDAARAERDATQAAWRELRQGTRQEQREQAHQFKRRAEAEIASASVDLERLTLRAPVSGRVDSLPLSVGNHPQTGAVLAVLLAGSAPYARVYVPETLRVAVRIGQSALVHFDGSPTPYPGVIRSVRADPVFTPFYALTERDRHRLSYIAKIDLTGAVSQLPVGAPVEVTLPELSPAP